MSPRMVYRLMLTAIFFAFVVSGMGCGGSETQVAEQPPPEPGEGLVLEEDLPAPPPESSGTTSRPQRLTGTVPEERTRPAAPPPPTTITLNIPEGTTIEGVFTTPLSSETAVVGDEVVIRLTHPVVAGDRVAFPEGSTIHGRVNDVKPASKGFKETSGAISITFDRALRPDGRSSTLAASLTMIAEGSGKKKAAIIGGSAAGGALLGKVLDKDTAGAAIIGGAIGTAVAGSTKGKELEIVEGDVVQIVLESPSRVTLGR